MSLDGGAYGSPHDAAVWFARVEGVVRLVQEVRWAAVSSGKETLESNLFQYCRRQSALSSLTARQPDEVAFEIRTVLDLGEAHPAWHEVVRRIPMRALQTSEARSLLLFCAEYLESDGWRSSAGDVGRSPNGMDIRGWFPELIRFSETLLEPEDDVEAQEILAEYIAGCHPDFCVWNLPPVVGEAQRALAAFPSEALLQDAFDRQVPIAAVAGMTWTEWLTHLAHTLTRHMREAHAEGPGESPC